MKSYITVINNYVGAAKEAQEQVANIAHTMGFREMGLYRYRVDTDSDEMLQRRLDGIIGGVTKEDIVVFQYPSWNGRRFDLALAHTIKAYANRLIVYVHDIDVFLFGKITDDYTICQYLSTDIQILNEADLIILASEKLFKKLQKYGLTQKNVIYQEIWDFPTNIVIKNHELLRRFLFSGGDDFSAYNGKIPIHQFSMREWTRLESTNVVWHGFIDRNSLLLEQAKGGFGLVYTDDDAFERYDSMNQPFKLACYLASGIPVIVRKGSVHEAYVTRNQIGFAVDTLEEADKIVSELSDEEYTKLYENVRQTQDLVTSGAYTRKLLSGAVVCAMEKNPEAKM